MVLAKNNKISLLLLGDLALFYVSLYLALLIRYQGLVTQSVWDIHQMPFLFIHILWLFIFYISGLYDVHIFASFKKITERVLKSMAASTIIAALIFYLMPGIVIIAPKTNLFIEAAILTVLLVFWRRLFWSLNNKTSKIKILFFGASKETKDLATRLNRNPQLGYEPSLVLESINNNFIDIIKQNDIQLVVASKNIIQDKETAKKLYMLLPLGVSIVDFESFYESLVEKIPVSLINETWFLENLLEINKKTFEIFKRVYDIIFAILLGIPTLLITPFISIAIKIESPGPIFLKQKRTGKNGSIFYFFKFRSMYALSPDGSAETEISGWEKPCQKDRRLTRIGNILRKTRIDELPQLWNILKGEMSFIGPRPERPEFVEKLEKEIPHYAMRHLVKPGASGWAQIKFTDASAKDAMEKLQFDLYYIKNRSLILDLAITAKTIATMLSHAGR